MDSQEKLFLKLKRPSLDEMIKIMTGFHNSDEFLKGVCGNVPASITSDEVLRKYGWDFEEYCNAIGAM